MRTSRPGWSLVPAGLLFGFALSLPAVAADGSRDGARKAPRKLDYIDAMLRDAWEGASIKPSSPANDAEFLRRAYLDLLGRIPSVQEAQAFLDSKEPAASKRLKLVDYLLEHPDYPKNFGNVWTIALMGRKDQGRRVDRPALANWLRRQFAEDRPWNEMAYELITASGSNRENGAANFAMAHLENEAVPLTSVTTRVFLGQQIQCTQCHDHPSNDWKQKDFWGINAFFKGVRTHQVTKSDATGAEVYDYTEVVDEPTDAYARFERRNAYMEIAFPTYLDGRKIAQGPDVNRRQELGKFITERDNLQFARAYVNRMWGHFLGRGFTHPVDDFGAHNEPSHPELLDKLAGDFRDCGYDTKALIRWITASRAYNLSSVTTRDNEKDDALFSHMMLRPMTPEQLFDSLLTATDAHKAAGADIDKTRKRWLDQFVVTFANDEEGETTNFQGTIPQALMMMNGELMAKATGGRPGSYLAKLLDQAGAQSRTSPEVFAVRRLYLSALSRYPSSAEMAHAVKYLGANPDTIEVIEDLFWALLNSNEFALIR